ncbi:MAG: two-component system, OmpR family, response regulator [Actinomycetota bacterium]|jgi:two-component system OmpR family response regulator|nr:two-component system, OmpR family, response regulator [Actinomycetota bacterium]
MRILVVEDEAKMADLLKRGLEREGYAVDVSTTGTDALWAVTEHHYDTIVLDANIPAPDGFEVCRRLREQEKWAPVLMLTARDAVEDRVQGLDAGADDYLTKPFAFAELFARVRALTRRPPATMSTVLQVDDLVLDPAARTVTRAGEPVVLSAKAFAVLEHLMRNAGDVCTRTAILEHVWDEAYDGLSNIVDVYVRQIRDAIDRPFSRDSIETLRGVGYRLQPGTGR